MADAIGPGMCVEYTGPAVWPQSMPPAIGARAWVVGVDPSTGACGMCGVIPAALILTRDARDYSSVATGWCPNHWRPVGGDREEPARTEAQPAPAEREPVDA